MYASDEDSAKMKKAGSATEDARWVLFSAAANDVQPANSANSVYTLADMPKHFVSGAVVARH